ncbi:hypothetical protein CV770_11225 [Bradyrhizobium sp. AC87j1]|uniref:hypothetical protein n=1 Tax=Bradyrhizobium sp. AC87j1 TaxID=2055894 RepID=UPI000CEC013D|nr:hypothetical protein [Bradyrhizobium sp. AC87j1]PPQ19237.1 hypothetical protein CV770_11225 [Bradyrhizobium sp. AC87j1]
MSLWPSKTAAVTAGPVETAHASMRKLSERGVEIPSHISTPITAVQTTSSLVQSSAETQSRFWAAYSALNSRIKSPEEARDHYRRFFYVILAALLLLQLYYSAFLSVQKGLLEVNKSIEAAEVAAIVAATAPAPAVTPTPAPTGVATAKNEGLVGKRQTYLHAADYLMGIPRKMAGFLGIIGLGSGDNNSNDKAEVVAQVQLDLATSFVGGFLLPVLYGMLGAIAFVLRRLSDETSFVEEATVLKRKFSLRVPIGALSGLAAGWLLQPSTGASVTASLSPFALAFVAGYSADLVFTALDRIVAAFTGPPSTQTPPIATPPERSPSPSEPVNNEARPSNDARPQANPDPIGDPPSAREVTMSSRAQANQDA